MYRCLIFWLAVFVVAANQSPFAVANDVQFLWDEGGVYEINVGGKPLFDGRRGPTGGIYLISSLTGRDLGNGTVTSGHAPANFLGPESPDRFPANTPLPPYKLRIRQMNDRRIRVYAEIGPMPTFYKTNDLAIDFGKGRMRRFDLGSDQYLQKDFPEDQIIPFPGNTFRSLPLIYRIKDLGFVGEGQRRATRELINWMSATGPAATVKVRVLESTHLKRISAANHPLANVLGFQFGQMHEGDVAKIRFYVTVTPK